MLWFNLLKPVRFLRIKEAEPCFSAQLCLVVRTDYLKIFILSDMGMNSLSPAGADGFPNGI
jgi:hypothetical protein